MRAHWLGDIFIGVENKHVLKRAKKINLALQGGGAHGAFTWGVLDRLLEDEQLKLDTVGGTSAGALNAVALAEGMRIGGRAGAKDKLHDIWKAVHEAGVPRFLRTNPFLSHLSNSDLGEKSMAHLFKMMSPGELNPLNLNPLRGILDAHIDFAELRRSSPVQLMLAATDVATGEAVFFGNGDLGVDAVLASTCLPTLQHTVVIDQKAYWDGGFSANPDLRCLASKSRCSDTLVVLLNPMKQDDVPTSATDIAAEVNRLTFNQPLLRDIQLIDAVRRARPKLMRHDKKYEALRQHRFHLIEAGSYTSQLAPSSKMKPDWDMLTFLREAGHDEADQWLQRHRAMIGKRETANLPDLFLNA